jgi:hypothetical protein
MLCKVLSSAILSNHSLLAVVTADRNAATSPPKSRASGGPHHSTLRLPPKKVLSSASLACHAVPAVTQAMDLIMGEDLPLRELDQARVDEDPLIILPCRHAFFMSGMDELLELEWRERSAEGAGAAEGALEMRGAYKRDGQGNWLEPAPLPVSELGPGVTCRLWVQYNCVRFLQALQSEQCFLGHAYCATMLRA